MRERGGGRQIYMYMLTMEELSKTCGNMGTWEHVAILEGKKEPPLGDPLHY